MKKLLAVALLVVLSGRAAAWNERGHMVVARLAWRHLSDGQRARVVAVLKKHPHYDRYLAAQRPDGFTDDEWVFLRAATWADWVRGDRDYDRPTWHYVNHPVVPPGSAVKASDHEPPPGQENVVTQLAAAADNVRTRTDAEQAVALTWLFHLVGDVHQPLHCTAVYSEQFPRGDQGGNLAFIRIRSSPVKLHAFWDGLLGTGTTAGNIGTDVREIEAVLAAKAADVRQELDSHPTFESWGREGQDLTRGVAYLDGRLKVAASTARRIEADTDVPTAPEDYAPTCGRVARVQVGKAGLRLADQLKKLFP